MLFFRHAFDASCTCAAADDDATKSIDPMVEFDQLSALRSVEIH
jgi:hypothetical protein